MGKEIPEFTAEELNILSGLARKNGYYYKCKDFILSVLNTEVEKGYDWLTEKQVRWLWGIKKELSDMVKGE